jgi:hypothetical protein
MVSRVCTLSEIVKYLALKFIVFDFIYKVYLTKYKQKQYRNTDVIVGKR